MPKIILMIFVVVSELASAQFFANPTVIARRTNLVTGGMLFSEVDYENGSRFDIERKLLAVDYAVPAGDDFDYIGMFGLSIDSELETEDGTGLLFGGGVRFLVHEEGPLRVTGYGGLVHVRDSMGDVDFSIFEFHGGGAFAYRATTKLTPYAAIGIVPFSDGEVEVGSASADIERDDYLTIRLGASFYTRSYLLHSELTFGGEQNFQIGASKTL